MDFDAPAVFVTPPNSLGRGRRRRVTWNLDRPSTGFRPLNPGPAGAWAVLVFTGEAGLSAYFFIFAACC
ncbi:hypothetical protein [Streptosporangium sp. NPDC001681]|uniref:hypothetical protein n=1 Tax=Streptosporangium sp. NPDC001681 TaxID=3154395 RepID=UPI003317507A